MRFRALFSTIVVASLLTISNTSHGAVLASYYASDYTGGIHGLWTSSSPGLAGGNNPFFSFQNATLTVYDDDSAAMDLSGSMDGTPDYVRLVGTVLNANGIDTALVDLVFSGFIGSDFAGNNIVPKGTSNGDETTWDYYTSVNGAITFSYNGGTVVPIDAMETNPDRAFQFGLGANDKNGEFGASAWIESVAGLPGPPKAGHWDLNLKLMQTPEPAAFVIWSIIGIVGLTHTYLRRRIAA